MVMVRAAVIMQFVPLLPVFVVNGVYDVGLFERM
jgi:hypothetical protein